MGRFGVKAEWLLTVEDKLSIATRESLFALLSLPILLNWADKFFKNYSLKGHQIINFFRVPWTGPSIKGASDQTKCGCLSLVQFGRREGIDYILRLFIAENPRPTDIQL